jgi:hypothetical protein
MDIGIQRDILGFKGQLVIHCRRDNYQSIDLVAA